MQKKMVFQTETQNVRKLKAIQQISEGNLYKNNSKFKNIYTKRSVTNGSKNIMIFNLKNIRQFFHLTNTACQSMEQGA